MNRAENLTKKTYVRLSISPVRVEIESSILTGSVTTHKISIANDGVNVVDFEKDTSFGSDGTWDISF